ncbi:uncharacterized protein LOC112043546 isoform X2 [Bicyclus anynana]|uniref:Uncharacterized protein LOC112043546 isoform X2 n=1 Tax=Bicyclus anynana TaxID=110368 RepID=A0A6J1MHQ2_BICAN|nr:uncharacterized protein LOC112043546 isoform X2 [Bicyclus anynana]
MPARPNPPGLVIKRHNIRIWCHECDMGRLQRVVWEGQGSRLLSEVSSQPVVKRFLEAVPYIMNTIRDIHSAVIQNDLEGIMRLTSDPIPPQALSSRDANNMTAMHKAAGLGHNGILKYIIERYPQGINDVDNEGRTPLHYAAVVKDDQHTYNTLTSAGADESAVDNKNRTPAYYINRTQDIDKNLFKILPEAPRTPSSTYPASWDWKILDTEFVGEVSTKKTKKKNLKASNENISSKNNTSTITDSTEANNIASLKNSSTHELISDLPDLNDSEKPIANSNNPIEDHTQDIKVTTEIENPLEENDEEEETSTSKDKKTVEEIENVSGDNNEIENVSEIINETENEKENEEKNEKENESNAYLREHENNNDNDQEESIENNTKIDSNENVEETAQDQDISKGEIVDDKNEDVELPAELNNEKVKPNETINNLHNENIDHKENHNGSAHNSPQKMTEENKSIEDDSNEHTIESNYNNHDDNITKKVNGHEDKQDHTNLNDRDNISNTDETVENPKQEGEDVCEGTFNGRNNQENLIEGIIRIDAEQETQDASITQRDNSVHSNNVVEKINRVHIAARDGNIRDLQAALDRRKFAIARDPISANGATPLHVATIHGKTNIIKYLGGRFPETLSAVDFEGRTALHYAAVLPDNGHYYNILQQLGANSKDLDDIGRSAEDYYRNPTLLPFRLLSSDFGISEEKSQTMFSDQVSGINHVTNGHMDIPIFHTEEGRYLAKSLGDPLIKGLTEVANVKPKDPVAFLATFLHNFPDQEKPRLGTQETNIIVTKGTPEVENDQLPLDLQNDEDIPMEDTIEHRARTAARTATRQHRPIEVIAVEPNGDTSPDAPELATSSANRDEHGQSMLHFAAARTHTNNALFQLLQESDVSLGYRDELYRTARDVSIQANVLENTTEIDRWVLHLAARGKTDKVMELLLQGYDHILDIVDEEGLPISEVVSKRGDHEMNNLLASIPSFEESRETLHGAIRRGDLLVVQEMIKAEGGRTLARAQNTFGRNSLHIAVLAQHEEIVAYLSENCPDLLRLGDNLERTPLHYAMGVNKMETLSHLLIQAGAKRVLKDLKGRQPSYYFMNKSDILRLKEEEEAY